MNKIFLKVILILSVLFFGCNNNDDTVKLDDMPNLEISNLTWLNDKIKDLSDSRYEFIEATIYEGNCVFIFNNCNPRINSVVPVYSYGGELIGIIGDGDNFIDPDLLLERKIVWKPVDFKCSL